MADLDLKFAEMLAGQLVTIGHPMKAEWLLATATDLVEWCKGGIFEGRPWMPAEQAGALVKEARTTFGDWTKAGGTTALLALFRAKFGKRGPEIWTQERADLEQARTIASAIARGHLTPPCHLCQQEGYPYCEYGGAKRHARVKAEQDARTASPRPKPVEGFAQADTAPRSPAQMGHALADEMRRKREQLETVGML